MPKHPNVVVLRLWGQWKGNPNIGIIEAKVALKEVEVDGIADVVHWLLLEQEGPGMGR